MGRSPVQTGTAGGGGGSAAGAALPAPGRPGLPFRCPRLIYGPGGWRGTFHSPTGSGPEGSSPNETERVFVQPPTCPRPAPSRPRPNFINIPMDETTGTPATDEPALPPSPLLPPAASP